MQGNPVSHAPSLLDDVMPRYDVSAAHSIWVSASTEDAYRALKAVTPKEVRLLGPLMAIRALPHLVRRASAPRLDQPTPLLEQFLLNGFLLMGERPGSEIVLGAIGRFWSLVGNAPLQTVQTHEDFLAFDEPGYCKTAMNLRVWPEDSGSRILTETRVAGTSAKATRLFGRYWFAVKLGSAAIRRSWLSAIRRRLDGEAK